MGWERRSGVRRRTIHNRDLHRMEQDVATVRSGRIRRGLLYRAERRIPRLSRASLAGWNGRESQSIWMRYVFSGNSFFFQAEDAIRNYKVTGVQRVLFR